MSTPTPAKALPWMQAAGDAILEAQKGYHGSDMNGNDAAAIIARHHAAAGGDDKFAALHDVLNKAAKLEDAGVIQQQPAAPDVAALAEKLAMFFQRYLSNRGLVQRSDKYGSASLVEAGELAKELFVVLTPALAALVAERDAWKDEARHKALVLTCFQSALSTAREREGIYLAALEHIAGNEAGTNFEEADGIAISAIESARALLTPPVAGTEKTP